jgi:arylsulfatase A
MKRTLLFLPAITLLIAASSVGQTLAADNPPAKPNVILILTDDVGLGDIGACGGPFKTPQIDALAKAGLRFEQCYSTPLCGPSRCQFMSS